MVNYTGKGLVVKRPGVLSKVQMLTLVSGVGVVSLLPIKLGTAYPWVYFFATCKKHGMMH